ncbi:MAG: uroporphyrinogen decarboxylase family protein, partial [Victivallales bacterium]
ALPRWQMMTPREKAIAALELRASEGIVPTMDLDFQLAEEFIGKPTIMDGKEELKGLSGEGRKEKLRENARRWVELSEKLDLCMINGTQRLGSIEDEIFTYGEIRRISGDDFMLAASSDGTLTMPGGDDMVEKSLRLADEEESMLAELDVSCERAIKRGVSLIEGGAEIVFMNVDYCFNNGPWISPAMSRKFVFPFLKRQVDAFHEAGAYVVKHSDGYIMPILDLIIESGVDAVHSLDPMAGVDIREVKEKYGREICLIGNVHCAHLQMGTKEEITRSARYALEHGGAKQGGFIYANSNCAFKGVPPENFQFMLDLREEYI